MFVKLTVPDIKNALEALEDLVEPTASEVRTIEKLRMIQALQGQKRQIQEREKTNA